MRERDVQLKRLLAAAKQAGRAGSAKPVPMPVTLETRILAHWRADRQADQSGDFLLLMFRRALACAGILMVAAAVWSISVPDTAPPEEAGDLLASSEVQADLLP